MSDLRYWIALSMLYDIGPVGSKKLLSVFGTPESIFNADINDLLAVEGIGMNRAKNIKDFSSWKDVEKLAPVLKGFIRSKNKSKIEITDEENKLCNLLSGEPKQIDVISRESGLPALKVLGILLGLELKGAVKQTMGKRFYLV